MSYTNPIGQPQGLAKSITNKLREALIAELDAINGYAEHIVNSDMTDINAVWHSILEDEMRHYGIFLILLRQFDTAQYQSYLNNISEKKVSISPMQTYVPGYSKQIILNNIREDIKGEFEASILYEGLASSIQNMEVKRTLYKISDEEKGHSEQLTRLLLIFDSEKFDGLES